MSEETDPAVPAESRHEALFEDEERADWRDPRNDVPIPFAVTELGRQACARGVL